MVKTGTFIKATEALGGMARFVRNGDRVVVKPNILSAREPQYAITTNPDVIGAAAEHAGGRVLVDTYGATLFGMGPDDIGHIATAIKMGLGSHDLEKSDIIRVAL